MDSQLSACRNQGWKRIEEVDLIVSHVLSYLSHIELCKISPTSAIILHLINDSLSQITCLPSCEIGNSFLLPKMSNLIEVNVPRCRWFPNVPGIFGGDIFLLILAENCLGLKRLDVSGNNDVSDFGCAFLAERCPELEIADISFCPNTSYKSVVLFYNIPVKNIADELSAYKTRVHETVGLKYASKSQQSFNIEAYSTSRNPCLCRIPPWFVGSFPIFGEIHTYFPDGSFSFNRDDQKEGWCRVSKVDEITYREEFLFLDIHGDMGDISVLLQYQPDTEEILIAQNISDWRPLAHFPMDPTNAISAIPCGESIHVFDSTEGSVALVSKIKALSSIEIAARISHRYPTGHIHTAASAAEQVTVDGLVVPAQQAQQAMGAVSAPAVEALAEAGVMLQRPPHELLHRLAQRCSTLPSPLPP